ncbi:MAG: NUDIX domain-containing protein [Aminobacterium sp.]|jgi:8-oxo-dGTP diphosphatase|uniref:NUDIX hydrolase n=1 Tax=unclassified Aminobacterium TaxID=2685012 RepID=UPI001BCDA7D0|nr:MULTISPECIES: NUDIX domain-containing protein [unclassified Aminobacterium]MDD2205871.1 NUDIX domain-containing protein [Aminobacterium sp.]MDD3426304.1 NUDIX domain-containing protein [Aminobacterium sp.]MDD3706680.1 NUDIX domain-containing protein [Aminobacterium sp.]MDD4228114.1 NUDIX domain-containing protein [Aminobacterium sp.]MDD4550859.1 NUDIX domain-containing protein [Aminobacterium sp.]
MNSEEYAYTSIIVFCFIVDKNKILLIRRNKEPYAATLTVPGGKKEKRESLTQACIREVQEETGLTPCSLELAGIVHNFQENNSNETLTFYFTCRSYSGELRSGEEGTVEWFDIDESFTLHDVNLFYLQIAPFVFSGKKIPFEGQIVLSEEGEIIQTTIDYLKAL